MTESCADILLDTAIRHGLISPLQLAALAATEGVDEALIEVCDRLSSYRGFSAEERAFVNRHIIDYCDQGENK